jgi:hypothetical protein
VAPGPVIRRLLGARLARHVGRWYRSIYVDLAKVAAEISTVIPRDANVLDVGGGDGQPLNHLLALRPDLKITTIDPAPVVGEWIERRFDAQVTRLPSTSLAEFLSAGRADPDVILISDVLHHIPPSERADFLYSVRILLERVPWLRIVVKDVELGSWRTALGMWSDRYITGDRDVSPISRENVERLLEQVLGPLHREDTTLFRIDRPNYAIVFYRL